MNNSVKPNLACKIGRAVPLAAAILLAFFITAVPVVGQMVDEGVRTDNVERLESSRPILEYVIAGVCIFGTLAIGFRSSNRATAT